MNENSEQVGRTVKANPADGADALPNIANQQCVIIIGKNTHKAILHVYIYHIHARYYAYTN